MLLAILAISAVGFGVLLGRPEPVSPVGTVSSTGTATTATVVETLTVHVSGLVMSPGVVDVAAGSIVADVIAAAGGLRTGAALEHLNLAAPVGQGDHIVVPGPGDALAGAPAAPDGVGGSEILSLNTASAAQLETLPGVGPVLAERIVSWREQHGAFDVVEDLLEVSGIGESKLAAMRDLVRP